MLGDVDCEVLPTVLAAGAPELLAAPTGMRSLAEPGDVVEFVVEGERLVAQRSTLAQHCTFFSNMFRLVFLLKPPFSFLYFETSCSDTH
jgi:hypothetical protein